MNVFEHVLACNWIGLVRMCLMCEPGRLKSVVDVQPVGHNTAARYDIITDKRQCLRSVRRWGATQTNPPKALRIHLNTNKNKRFAFGSTPPGTLPLPPYKRLVHFHEPVQLFTPGAHHDAAQLLKPAPGGLVTSKTVHIA